MMRASKFFSVFAFVMIAVCGCSVEASKHDDKTAEVKAEAKNAGNSAVRGASIQIDPGSPADTVRAFYSKLRDKKFREAIYLTNLRPAVEGLTDTELKDFDVDFEAISQQIPQVIEINGEIISGDNATVTAHETTLRQLKNGLPSCG